MTLNEATDRCVNDKINILISGCTCSGKTTLANSLSDHSKRSCTVISQDNYFKNIEDIPITREKKLLFDSPNAFYMSEFSTDMDRLISEGKVLIPNYSVKANHRLSKDIEVLSSNINIFEGLHTIRTLRGFDNIFKIFLDTDIDLCLERRIERDKKYGMSRELVEEYFWKCIYPMYKSYIENQKNLADYIVESESDAECLQKKLLQY